MKKLNSSFTISYNHLQGIPHRDFTLLRQRTLLTKSSRKSELSNDTIAILQQFNTVQLEPLKVMPFQCSDSSENVFKYSPGRLFGEKFDFLMIENELETVLHVYLSFHSNVFYALKLFFRQTISCCCMTSCVWRRRISH